MKAWLQRQFRRSTFYPAVALITSIVWLFTSPCGVAEFNAWCMGAGVFVGILSGGVLIDKSLARKPAPARESAPADPRLNESQEIDP